MKMWKVFYEPECFLNVSNSNSASSHVIIMICFAIAEDGFHLHKPQRRHSSAAESLPRLTQRHKDTRKTWFPGINKWGRQLGFYCHLLGEVASAKRLYRDRAKISEDPSQPRGKLSCPCFLSSEFPPPTSLQQRQGWAAVTCCRSPPSSVVLCCPLLLVHFWLNRDPWGRRNSHKRVLVKAILMGMTPSKACRKHLLLALWNIARESNRMYRKLPRLV